MYQTILICEGLYDVNSFSLINKWFRGQYKPYENESNTMDAKGLQITYNYMHNEIYANLQNGIQNTAIE